MNFRLFTHTLAVGVAFAVFSHAAPLKKYTPPPADQWQKRWWIEKAIRILRKGEGIRPNERMQDFLTMEREQVLDYLMNDPAFQDTIVDFGFFFQGMRSANFRIPKAEGGWQYDELILTAPQLIDAAKAFSNRQQHQGDFLSILKIAFPDIYTLPTYQIAAGNDDFGLPEELVRRKYFGLNQANFDNVIKLLEANPQSPESRTAICSLGAGTIPGINNQLALWLTKDERGFGKFLSLCIDQERIQPGSMDLLSEAKRLRDFNRNLFKKMDAFHRSKYQVNTIDDFRKIDFSDLPPEQRPLMYTVRTDNFTFVLTNSSTNYDRRRGAHILRRYFCDDLTPISFLPPDEHSRGRHASDPSCRACHYKLDPMAGFFRNYGFYFLNYSHMDKMMFDDLATTTLSEYQSNWRAEPTTGREWNVGYVRSAEQEELNSYGSTLEDLSQIIYDAPETKKCLVKRMFEYFVGENQAIDSGYINHLTTELMARPQNGHADGARYVIKQLLLGGTFSKRNPIADECYDHAPDFNPENSPPCRVAFVMQKNCATCHNPTSMKGRLDLTSWVRYENEYTFPHTDRAGNQIPPRRTFESILNRITTTNKDDQMPLNKYMSAADREAIFLWVKERLDH
jgi:hypothetical protein